MTINPAVRDEPYSAWALDNAAEMRAARDKLWPLLEQALPLAEALAEKGAPLSAYCMDSPHALFPSWHGHEAEDLAAFLADILAGDREKAHDLDLERFEEELG